jgi:hypothetical protein
VPWDSDIFWTILTVPKGAPQMHSPGYHTLINVIQYYSIDIYYKSMPISSNSCDVGIHFLIFLRLPFSVVFAFAIAASWDSCDALSQVGLCTRPERRASGFELLVSVEAELSSDELSSDEMLGVLESSDSWVSRWGVRHKLCLALTLAILELSLSYHCRCPHVILILVLLGPSALLCLVLFLLFRCLSSCHSTLPTSRKSLEIRLQ